MEDPNWTNLPEEVLAKIFSYFSFYEKILTLSLVCTCWARVCYDPVFTVSYTINSNKLSCDEILQKLRAAPHLKYLRIVNRDDLNLFLRGVGAHNRKLKCLSIKNCLGSTKSQKNISSTVLLNLLSKCKMIESLTIKYTPILCKRIFHMLGTMMPNLKKISFTIDLDAEDLSAMFSNCKNLESIKLLTPYKTAVENKTVQDICESSGKHLTVLKLNATKLTDYSLESLMYNCPHLTKLHLIGPIQMLEETIAKIPQLSLTSLSLTHTRIPWLRINFFDQWCAQLKKLNVSGCISVNDEVLLEISTFCYQLEKLNISRCQGFTHIGLSYVLKNCKKLTHLNLHLTSKHLMKMLPYVMLHYNIHKLKELIYKPYGSRSWDTFQKRLLDKIRKHYPDLRLRTSADELTLL